MRSRGVNNLHRIVSDQRNGLSRCVVRQAQNHGVDGIEQRSARVSILALRRIDGRQFEVAPRFEALADLQARGARFTVNKNSRSHRMLPKQNGRFPEEAPVQTRCEAD
jgi:hypothetical protein